MLNKIIEFSVKNKLIIGLFVAALIIYGFFQVKQLPIDAVPDITNNQVQVITIAPAYGATDIESLVTFPIEQANSNIRGLQQIRSFSRAGLSIVTIVFEDKVDVYWARQQVAERMQQVQSQIPQGIGTPTLGPITTGLGEIYQYVVRPKKGYEKKYNETELRTIQDWIVRRQLLGVKGVAEVGSFGGKLKQYEVSVDPNKLKSYGITINNVFTALQNNNQNTGGAYIEKGPTVLFIRSEGLIGTIDDIKNIPVKSNNAGTPLFIRDVANVNIGYATRYGAMCYDDEGEVSGAVVMMLKGANSNEVIKNVKQKVAEVQKTLPEGVVIEPFLDRTKMVDSAIHTVKKNLMEGALIVVFILVLFLGNVRSGLLVASVIPLAMLFAVILMNIFGVSGNLMSLGALDFGLIVDGAVIIVEAVMHHIKQTHKAASEEKISQEEMNGVVTESAGKMMNSAVFGQVIILIVYIPIFTLEGIEGKMFRPMAETVSFALIGAFLLSLTYIPMMSALVLSKKVSTKRNISDRMMQAIENTYHRALKKVLRFPKTVLALVIALFIIAVVVFNHLGGEFIPEIEEGDFAVDTRVLSGSSLNTTIESTQKAAHILITQFPEVEKVVTKIGSGEVPTDPMPMDASDMMVILKDKKQWTSAKTFPELSEKMGKALEAVSGITTSFQFPVQMRFNELMTGARQDVVCKIFGENLDVLAENAAKLAKIIGTVKGSSDLYVEPVTGMPQIIIQYHREAMAQYNLNIADVNNVINAAFAGKAAGLVFEGEKRFDLVVKLQSDERKNLADVQNLLVPTPMGTQVPLYQVANVSIQNGPYQVQREDSHRRIVVGFNTKDRDVQSIVKELQEKVSSQLKLPPGYYVTYGGEFENLIAAKKRLSVAVPASLIMIFILLFFALHSVKQGLLIYTAIPLSAIGGVFFLAMRGLSFSISAGIGFIALFGVAVLNGIVLIAEFQRQKEAGYTNIYHVIFNGTSLRLRPVLMTASVASLGFLPMALSNGAGAEVQRPLATVVIGGLLTATFLTLFVLPVLYAMFNRKKHSSKKKTMKKVSFMLLVLCTSGLLAQAQQTITLQQAIDTAIKNNLTVKNARLKENYQKRLIKSAVVIPPTSIIGEVGQINSAYTDNRFGIMQTTSFPTVYARQRKLYEEEFQNALLNTGVQEHELIKSVSQLFFTIKIEEEKIKLLLKADSNYAAFVEKARLRLKTGESNILEKTTAETQRGNIQLQLKTLQQELEMSKAQFQLLLNTTATREPQSDDITIDLSNLADSTTFSDHPLIKLYRQQQKIAAATTMLERARLLPDLSAAYYNMTMQGTGADNKMYTASHRFQSFQVGVGIPIFNGAQKTKISAGRLNELVAASNLDIQLQTVQTQFRNTLTQYRNNLQAVNYYRSIALQNADTIIQTANLQFVNGEINYLEWVMLTNQAYTIQSNYLDAVQALNESIISLNYYVSNNTK
ncbi:MAG: CusA/CzcA family heavy metal efflux RND transporter [Bacteroidota bacterium]|nr:CusA/CzcA family heavy metal efflux RND transporter [Bacteroidota bacterium]